MSAEKHVAIVLAGGSGRRMGMDMPKQYLAVGGKPLIYFALKAFQDSAMDEIVLVCGRGETDFCRTRIVEQYELTKVKQIVEGGAERYHSVWEGLKAAGECDYIYVHDGARPFLEQETICRLMASVKQEKACVAAVPVKDTIKVTDADGVVVDTPPRDRLWTVQTPQCFAYQLIYSSYQKMIDTEREWMAAGLRITDDAMAVEYFSDAVVRVVMGSYRNRKITTPDDLLLLQQMEKETSELR